MKYFIFLGNGFSLDFLHHIGKAKDIPLSNLFAYGDKLHWPNQKSAFLSFRNTPNLWLLGIRPSNNPERNNQIVESIITCANTYFLKKPAERSFGQDDKRNIYIDAYRELVVYLKYLFVKFDNEVPTKDAEEWPWATFLKALHKDKNVDEVCIVTLNYDLWLERVLEALGIPYSIPIISNGATEKFSIFKPHGSISFLHNAISAAEFTIDYQKDYFQGAETDFEVSMDNLDRNTLVIPLIPPAGDSERFGAQWAHHIRQAAVEKAGTLTTDDKVIICGISYWHVDRREIDELLIKLKDRMELAFINPHPPETFDAVLTSLFKQYAHYTSISSYLGVRNA